MNNKTIFIDTGAFLALEDTSDQYRKVALQFRDNNLAESRYGLVTSSYILDESLTLIRAKIGIKQSIDFCRKIRSSNLLRIVSITRDIETAALDLFEQYDDKDFSFTDCISFVLMDEIGIKEVFGSTITLNKWVLPSDRDSHFGRQTTREMETHYLPKLFREYQ